VNAALIVFVFPFLGLCIGPRSIHDILQDDHL
jgi:hypothetical protein